MTFSCSFVFCHVLLFFAATLSMNTRLPTAVAVTRLWGFSSLQDKAHRGTLQKSQGGDSAALPRMYVRNACWQARGMGQS